jgi:hypothetical protein
MVRISAKAGSGPPAWHNSTIRPSTTRQIADRGHAPPATRQPWVRQKAHKVLRQELVHHIPVGAVRELVLKAGDEPGVGVHRASYASGNRSTSLFNITSTE